MLNTPYRFLNTLILLLCSLELFAAKTIQLPPAHISTYQLYKYDSKVADLKNTLSYNEQQVRYISVASASGLASLFVSEDIVENSQLNWVNTNKTSQLQQQKFFYYQGKNHKKNQQMDFNWTDSQALQIQGVYRKKQYTLSSDTPVWSRQMLPLLASSVLSQDNTADNYSFNISERGKIHSYTYTFKGEESVNFAGQSVPCLKFEISRQGSKRKSLTWLSAEHYYLPIKIEQYKNNELNISIQLKNLQLTR